MPTATAFGQSPAGEAVQLFTLTSTGGARATISTYGGTLTGLLVPDKQGRLRDVVLGFADPAGYQSPAYLKAGPYFGALIGRYANRLAGAAFTLDGRRYQLAANNGPNTLHGGLRGFDKVVWQAKPGRSDQGPTLQLTYRSPDGEEGFPGTLRVAVTYTLTPANALVIDYTATTDQATPVNLTNHAYFNLGVAPTVLAHEVTILADAYTPIDANLIPTGELQPVAGTPFDFTRPRPVGERIEQVGRGYDHNWVLRPGPGQRAAAFVRAPDTGITLQVLTTEPGLQFYTGNYLDGTLTGKDGAPYGPHAGFCLETQHFPDSPNQPAFPSTILRPGQQFSSTTTYQFGVQP